jgi:glutamate-5-semialdehyde dehydrogenase
VGMTRVATKLAPPVDVDGLCDDLATRALAASRSLTTTTGAQRAGALLHIADLLEQRGAEIVEANARDLAAAQAVSDAFRGKLALDRDAVTKMAQAVRQIAAQADPIGHVIEGYVRPNGLRIEKVRVPLGVVLIIYESRPNVTCDAAALCLKSGNAVILRGGKEAMHSNTAIAQVVREALEQQGLDRDIVQLVPTADRAVVGRLLKMEGKIDVAIPRGGESLIRAVVEQSHIPVIKHYTGNCHVYVDRGAAALGTEAVRDICVNAKTQRPGVCNAAESMLFHIDTIGLLRDVATALAEQGVELRGCRRTVEVLRGIVPAERLKVADESDWSAEYLDLILAVRIVDTLAEAVEHINRYG